MEALLKLLVLVQQLSEAVPAAVAAVKGAFSEEDEAKLKEAVAALRAKNDASYEAILASLKSKA